MKNVNKFRLAVAAIGAVTLLVKAREHAIAKTPVNEEVTTIQVDGHTIQLVLVDHFNGVDYTAYADSRNKRIYFPRKLWNTRFKDALLHHEIGHVVLNHVAFEGDKLGLIKIELEADQYSVQQGNINELIAYRSILLPLTILDPSNYNNINLGYLVGTKIRSLFK